MNIEKLKAARDEYNGSLYPHTEGRFAQANMVSEETVHIIRTLLDNAINAPDLSELKREVTKICRDKNELETPDYVIMEAVANAIDHLAPRIVREGFVVVPVEVIKEINRLSKMNTSREYKESENYNYDEEDIGATFIDAYDMFVRDVRLLNKKVIAASKGD